MERDNVKRLLRQMVKVYAAYVVLSIAILLPLLNLGLTKIYQQLTGRQLAYELVGFNPFTLSVFAYGIKDFNSDGTLLWSIDQLLLNPSLVHSLSRRAIAMDAIEIQGLILQPEQYANSRYNFSDILQHLEAQSTNEAPTQASTQTPFALPRVWIGDFKLYATRLQYTEQRQARPFSSGLQDFQFNLKDFSTLSEDGDGYQLRAEGAHGGIFEWQGQIAANQSKTWGRFALSNFTLLPLWQFMEPQLNFTLNSGELSLQGDYEFNWQAGFDWKISNALASLDNLDLSQTAQSTRRGESPSQLQFTQLALALSEADSRQKAIRLSTINLTGFALQSGHQDAHPFLADMFSLNFPEAKPVAPSPAQNSETKQASSIENSTVDGSPSWRVFVKKTQLADAKVSWKVPELDDRHLTLYPINVNLLNFNNGNDPAQFNGALTIDQQAKISVNGALNLQTQSAEISATASQFPLNWSNPLFTRFLNATIHQGELSAETQFSIDHATLTQVSANLAINNFDLLDLESESVASLQQLNLTQLRFVPADDQLTIDRLTIAQLNTLIAINADGSTNLNRLFKAADAAPAANKESPIESRALNWRLNDIELVEADIKFTDETPLSTFSTQIQAFSGHIKNIQSDKSQALSVDMKGNVDGYAPVTLKGKAKPFLDDPAMDLALDFKSIDLGLFNPYSTTFTGWKIEKGLLNVNLNYQLEDKRIVGKNHVILDQLTLGERIDSRRLVDIPLRLALALLTDENGIVDLQIPVKGTTDQPDFSIGAIVWSAVRNSVMKVITAPFNLLASLVDSDEELGQVEFNSLSSLLSDSAKARLTELKTAMEQRPKLRLGITGDVLFVQEGQAFQAKQLNTKLLKLGLKQDDIEQQSAAWQKAVRNLLKDTEKPPEALSNAELLTFAIDRQPDPLSKLQRLAEKRAAAVKQFLLVNLELEPERVFVKSTTLKCTKVDRCQEARAVFTIKP